MPFGRPSQRANQRAIAYRDWLQQRNGFAIASVVLGLFSLLEFGAVPIFSLGAIAFGIVALSQLKLSRTPARPLGHRLAWTGLVLGALSIGVFIFIRTLPAGQWDGHVLPEKI
jgi:ABC-type branched-subunit amino acid transport system permease subunit